MFILSNNYFQHLRTQWGIFCRARLQILFKMDLSDLSNAQGNLKTKKKKQKKKIIKQQKKKKKEGQVEREEKI